ncbi:MAG: [protein-PII] uridylyltransferase, partial [Marinovum sp.]|nr:[protein-PII] uridylyltransferase [Marinovum sp.]
MDEVGLVSAPEKIFDTVKVASFLNNCFSQAPDLKIFRDNAVVELRRIRNAGMDEIASSFLQDPLAAEKVIRSYTWLTDCIVKSVWNISKIWLHPVPNPTQAEKLSLIAVGGYGRREMAPYSDED